MNLSHCSNLKTFLLSVFQGLNQAARQYLHAALTSAKEFDDKFLQAQILHQLGDLSFRVRFVLLAVVVKTQ